MQSGSWFEVQAKGLDSSQRDVLGLLALYGDANISTLTELANAAGLRATPTRQLSTTTLRPQVDALLKASVARHGNGGFGALRMARHSALRDAAARGRLDALARVVIANRFAHDGGRAELAQKRMLELDVALARGGAEVEAALARALDGASALGNVPSLEVAARSVFPALLPFDRAWFEQLPEAVQSLLFRLAVSFAENTGNRLGDLYEYASARPRLFAADPSTLSALFGVAILAGDLAKAALLARSAQGDMQSTLQGALALATGAFAEPHPFVPPKKDEPIGVARLLQGLLVLGRGRVEDLDAAERIAQAGSGKAASFKCSSGWLRELIELSQGRRSPFQKRAFESSGDTDCLNGLFRATFAIWADDASVADLSPVPMERYATYFNDFGQHWLAAQYRACAKRLERVSRPVATPGTIFGPQIGTPKPKASNSQPDTSNAGMTVRPLFELRTAKEPWELSLEALERVAATAGPDKPGQHTPVEERILWRVSPSNLDIEPYLQVSKAGAFTRGRKLAIKHLLAGAKQLERLPAEDRAVAQHARERREPSYGYGYPQVFHSLEARAWLDLIGHPRVELQGTEQPVEVVRGRVQVLAEAQGDALILKLEPNDLTRELSVRQEPGKLVVYQVEKQALPLLALLQKSLALPLAARERALATLGRLAHLVPVQTSERTAAKPVPADARLWLRVVPRSGGLSVAAFVRPLGAAGPELVPGVGAAHLLGHLGGADRARSRQRTRRAFGVARRVPTATGLGRRR